MLKPVWLSTLTVAEHKGNNRKMQENSEKLFNFQQNSRGGGGGSIYFKTIKVRWFFVVLVVVLFLNKIPAEGDKWRQVADSGILKLAPKLSVVAHHYSVDLGSK